MAKGTGYPVREQVMRYDEGDLTSISLLLSEVGIWFRFVTDARLKIGVIGFYDDQSGHEHGLTLLLHHPSGLHDDATETVWGPNIAYSVMEKSITTRDYSYLNEQPQGWLSAHRLMETLRQDTVHELPPGVDGKTRLALSRTESRNQLKQLHAQQNWTELLEQADLMFSIGISHFWLDIQWYLHQMLTKVDVPWDKWAVVIHQDLALLLERLLGLENLAWNDGTSFADEVTRNWTAQQAMMWRGGAWLAGRAAVPTDDVTSDVLTLEPKVPEMVDSQGMEAALGWIQTRPSIAAARQRLLLRLLMVRVAEQHSKNKMTLPLLEKLDTAVQGLTLTQWKPDLLPEIKVRQLELLRLRVHRYADKALLNRKIEILLGTLVTTDPVRAAVLCDTQYKDWWQWEQAIFWSGAIKPSIAAKLLEMRITMRSRASHRHGIWIGSPAADIRECLSLWAASLKQISAAG